VKSLQGPNPLGFRLDNNLIIVDALINGNDVNMIVDTGAGATLVSHELAERLGLRKAGQHCGGMGAGGDVEMDAVEVASMTIGSVSLCDMTPLSMDLSPICDRLETNVDGVIGFDFLSQTRLSIDYSARQLVLEPARS